MDGFIDLIAGIFGFLYDAIAYLLRGTIESPFGALVLGLFFYSIYKSGKHYNSKCCESDDELHYNSKCCESDDELQRNISRLGKQIDELTDDFNKLADNIKQPSEPKDK